MLHAQRVVLKPGEDFQTSLVTKRSTVSTLPSTNATETPYSPSREEEGGQQKLEAVSYSLVQDSLL
jgi:hypothetical protein